LAVSKKKTEHGGLGNKCKKVKVLECGQNKINRDLREKGRKKLPERGFGGILNKGLSFSGFPAGRNESRV